MATALVRDLDDAVYERLKARAAGNNRSLVPVVEIVVLPLSLLEAFHRTKDPCQDCGYLLRFLSPLSVPSSPLIKMT